MQESIIFLNNLLNDNDYVIAGISSGPDSMCLLDLLMNLDKKINIVCAHIHHGVRKQSDEEYEYLENYCNDHNIIFEGLYLKDLPQNNFEEAARKKRYEFFYNLKDKYNAKYILTAHHGDDLIETIQMRISRGSTLSGYIGIKLIDNDLVRPLLYTNKEEIISYLNTHNVKYYLDDTNNELNHTRNRYRHNIIKFLHEENPSINKKYIEFSKELESYDVFINKYVENHQIINNNEIDIDKLSNEDDLIKRKSIELLIKNIQKYDYLDISNNNMKELLNILNSSKPNLSIDLNNNYVAKKKYNKFIIEKKTDVNNYKYEFNNEYEDNYFKITKIDNTNDYSNNCICLSSKDVTLPLYITNKEDGDIIEMNNLGTKKVKDIFIDSKIDIDLRKIYPILKDSKGKVLWIPALKKSKFAKDKNENYDIILLCERKQNNETK